MKWVMVALAILYALVPVDLLPDFLTVLGWLDDLLLVGIVWYFFFRRADAPSGKTNPDKEDTRHQSRQRASEESADSEAERDPYQILGVPPGADPEEIRSAYRRLAARYHPDKVAHLGEEFQAVAEKKFKTIQAAYDTLRKRR